MSKVDPHNMLISILDTNVASDGFVLLKEMTHGLSGFVSDTPILLCNQMHQIMSSLVD